MSDCNIEISPITIPIQGIEIRNTSIIKERSPFTIPNQGSLRKYFYSNKNKRSTHPYLSPLSYTDHLASNRKTWASPWLGSQCQASRNVVLYATSTLASWSAAVWEETKHLSTNNNNTGTNIPSIGSTGSNPGCILGRRCPPKPPEFNDLPELLLQGEDLWSPCPSSASLLGEVHGGCIPTLCEGFCWTRLSFCMWISSKASSTVLKSLCLTSSV